MEQMVEDAADTEREDQAIVGHLVATTTHEAAATRIAMARGITRTTASVTETARTTIVTTGATTTAAVIKTPIRDPVTTTGRRTIADPTAEGVTSVAVHRAVPLVDAAVSNDLRT